MMTIRTHDQFNTTIYGLNDRYRGVFGGRRVILMNQEDMAERGLSAQMLVDLTSHFANETRVARRFVVVPLCDSARLHGDLFPRDQCPGSTAESRGQKPHTNIQVCGHHRRQERKLAVGRHPRGVHSEHSAAQVYDMTETHRDKLLGRPPRTCAGSTDQHERFLAIPDRCFFQNGGQRYKLCAGQMTQLADELGVARARR